MGALLRRGESDLHQFVRFVGAGFPLPLPDCVHSGLRQDWMATLDIDRFHAAVGSNQGIDFDNAGQCHGTSQARI